LRREIRSFERETICQVAVVSSVMMQESVNL